MSSLSLSPRRSSPLSTRPRATTTSKLSMPSPAFGFFSTPQTHLYLPFNFGIECEILIRPRANVLQTHAIPEIDASSKKFRDFNLALREVVAQILTAHGMECIVFEPEEDDKPDYSKWNAMLDGSISKKHMKDGFYPIEVVSPLISADDRWVQVIDTFWQVLLQHFELRRDTSCGFHIHISTATGRYTLDQLRMVAKSVVFWEPATARCAPYSRQDQVLDFCKSNIKVPVPVASILLRHGPLRSLQYVFEYIDNANVDTVVDFISPDKYRAWNLLPCRTGGHGSIEFRRPPGVVTAKQAKHWIAFTMAFVEMAMQFNPIVLANHVQAIQHLNQLSHPDFEDQLLASARQLGVFTQLDPRLRQLDEPKSLHITMMTEHRLRWLRRFDSEYHFSLNN